MFDCILIPLDGSETAEAALAYAKHLPCRRLRLLHVQPKIVGPIRADPVLWEAWQRDRAEDAAVYLRQVSQPLRREMRVVETAFRVGDPAEEIIGAGADADLIVMSTQGRGTAGRALYGSVADSVARHASVPTLLVRAGMTAMASPAIRRVVVPLDGSMLSAQALPVASMVAADLGVPVRLVRVVDDAPRAMGQDGAFAAFPGAPSQEAEQRQAVAELAGRAEALGRQDLAVTTEVLTGRPAVALLDTIRHDDLVVMTTHGWGGARRWLLGSVADKLVRAAEGPVMLVRATAPGALA